MPHTPIPHPSWCYGSTKTPHIIHAPSILIMPQTRMNSRSHTLLHHTCNGIPVVAAMDARTSTFNPTDRWTLIPDWVYESPVRTDSLVLQGEWRIECLDVSHIYRFKPLMRGKVLLAGIAVRVNRIPGVIYIPSHIPQKNILLNTTIQLHKRRIRV